MDDKKKDTHELQVCKYPECQGINLWVAEHDARTNAWWTQQHRDNEAMFKKLRCIDTRVTTIEKKIMLVCGVFAGLGALLGNALPFLFEHWKGP